MPSDERKNVVSDPISRRLSFDLPYVVREHEVALLLRLIRPAPNRGFRENVSRLDLSLFLFFLFEERAKSDGNQTVAAFLQK